MDPGTNFFLEFINNTNFQLRKRDRDKGEGMLEIANRKAHATKKKERL